MPPPLPVGELKLVLAGEEAEAPGEAGEEAEATGEGAEAPGEAVHAGDLERGEAGGDGGNAGVD